MTLPNKRVTGDTPRALSRRALCNTPWPATALRKKLGDVPTPCAKGHPKNNRCPHLCRTRGRLATHLGLSQGELCLQCARYRDCPAQQSKRCHGAPDGNLRTTTSNAPSATTTRTLLSQHSQGMSAPLQDCWDGDGDEDGPPERVRPVQVVVEPRRNNIYHRNTADERNMRKMLIKRRASSCVASRMCLARPQAFRCSCRRLW